MKYVNKNGKPISTAKMRPINETNGYSVTVYVNYRGYDVNVIAITSSRRSSETGAWSCSLAVVVDLVAASGVVVGGVVAGPCIAAVTELLDGAADGAERRALASFVVPAQYDHLVEPAGTSSSSSSFCFWSQSSRVLPLLRYVENDSKIQIRF